MLGRARKNKYVQQFLVSTKQETEGRWGQSGMQIALISDNQQKAIKTLETELFEAEKCQVLSWLGQEQLDVFDQTSMAVE